MREALQLTLGRHPHLLQAIDQAEPLIERIPGQRATEASIILLQQRAQNRAPKRSPTAQLKVPLLAAAHPALCSRQPSLQSAFHEIPLHAAAIQKSLDLLQAFSEGEVIDIAKDGWQSRPQFGRKRDELRPRLPTILGNVDYL